MLVKQGCNVYECNICSVAANEMDNQIFTVNEMLVSKKIHRQIIAKKRTGSAPILFFRR